MQELRLLGVHNGGERLLLSDPSGEQYVLPLDEALRRAVARAAARPSARESGTPALSPRDIQARIRAGATAAEVAEESGLPLSSVERYEGPVLAEREHIASQARKVEVPGHLDDGEGYRSAFGQDRASLGEMVEHRLKQLGVSLSRLEWDSRKTGHGLWEVMAYFELPEGFDGRLGEESPARWTFSPVTRSLQNANRWAQHLSELEPLELHTDSPWGGRRLTAVRDSPYDVEAEEPQDPDAPVSDAEGLVDLLNARRGQRLGVDEDGDDALALLLTQGIPAAHPRPGEGEDEVPAPPRLTVAFPETDEDEDALALDDGISPNTRQIRIVPSAPEAEEETSQDGPSLADEIFAGKREKDSPEQHESAQAKARALMRGDSFHRSPQDVERARAEEEKPAADQREQAPRDKDPDAEHEAKQERPAAKRRSVPSWDEIVFGTKGDN